MTDQTHPDESPQRPPRRRAILFTQRAARPPSRRRGAVLVETALVIILLLALCFGVMEYGHYVYTRHTLEAAAQRGARIGILRASTEQEINDAVEAVMDAAGYDNTEFDMTLEGFGDDTETDISVTIGCVWGDIGVRPLGLISSESIVQATVTMRKEGP